MSDRISGGEAVRVVRDRWWLLLLAMAVASLVAYGYTRLPFVEPRWKSSVWLQATGRFDYGNTLALERQLRPLAEQARQLAFMREVNRNLHLDLPPERMLDLTRAEPVQDSNQIRIDVEDADPPRAEAIALEIASVYTSQHNANQQGKLREEQVLLAVLDRPSTASLSWPQTRVLVPVAALLGLLGAVAVVLGLAYLDDTLKAPEDVERLLGLPLLGVIPRRRDRAPTDGTAAAADQTNVMQLGRVSPTVAEASLPITPRNTGGPGGSVPREKGISPSLGRGQGVGNNNP